ncbi:MAG: hypothetical protein QM765_30720 [Myxococcales bacterium]
MHKLLSFTLSILSLILAAHCGFRFDNPVEQCLTDACHPADSSVPALPDSGPGDASVSFPAEVMPVLVAKLEHRGFGSPSVGLTKDETPFIMFVDGANSEVLRVATRNEAWQVTEASSSLWMSQPAAVDGFGPAGFSASTRLVLFELSGGSWNGYLLGGDFSFSCRYNGALLPDGSVDAVRLCSGVLGYAHWDGNRTAKPQLTFEESPVLGTDSSFSALLRDGQGRLHVLATDSATQELVHLLGSGTTWDREVLQKAHSGYFAATLDASGELAYCWSAEGAVINSTSVTCARKVGGQWETKPALVNAREQGLNLRGLAIDSSGRMHFSGIRYEGQVGGRHTMELWSEQGSGWQTTELASSESQLEAQPLERGNRLEGDRTPGRL